MKEVKGYSKESFNVKVRLLMDLLTHTQVEAAGKLSLEENETLNNAWAVLYDHYRRNIEDVLSAISYR